MHRLNQIFFRKIFRFEFRRNSIRLSFPIHFDIAIVSSRHLHRIAPRISTPILTRAHISYLGPNLGEGSSVGRWWCIPVHRNPKDLQFHAPTLPRSLLFFSLSPTLTSLLLILRPTRKRVSYFFLRSFYPRYTFYIPHYAYSHAQWFTVYTHDSIAIQIQSWIDL